MTSGVPNVKSLVSLCAFLLTLPSPIQRTGQLIGFLWIGLNIILGKNDICSNSHQQNQRTIMIIHIQWLGLWFCQLVCQFPWNRENNPLCIWFFFFVEEIYSLLLGKMKFLSALLGSSGWSKKLTRDRLRENQTNLNNMYTQERPRKK